MSISKKINVAGLLEYKIKQTQHSLRLRMDEVLRTLDLTTPQYAALRPGISNAVLACSSFITAQIMHGIVSNLEKRHLVKRKSDPQRGRILCTELTKQGMKIVQQAHNMISKVQTMMVSTITEDN
jgi:DNA-binding MarR family transcriptional regulator